MVKELIREGYSVKDSCKALGVSRSRYYSFHKQGKIAITETVSNVAVLEKIKSIKTEHPFWGYRRVTAWLRHREGFLINHKRVRKIMKENELLATQTVYKAKRKVNQRKPKAVRPKQIWGIDMTKFIIPSIGWVYLVVVLDWYTKKIVGWNLSLRSRSLEWREAMDLAIQREFPEGVRGNGLKLKGEWQSANFNILHEGDGIAWN